MPQVLQLGGGAGWLSYDGSRNAGPYVIAAASLTSTPFGDACRVSDTLAAATYLSSGDIHLVIAKTDGTFGAVVVDSTGESMTALQVARVSDTKVVVLYAIGGGGIDLMLRTYTIGGVTPTLDAALQYAASSDITSTFGIAVLSETRAHMLYDNGTNVVLNGVTIGNASLVADGSTVTVTTNGSANLARVVGATATTSVVTYSNTSDKYSAVVATDGTPPTLGTPVVLCGTATYDINTGAGVPAVNTAGTRVACLLGNAAGGGAQVVMAFDVSGTTLTANASLATALGSTIFNTSGRPLNVEFLQDDGSLTYFMLCTRHSDPLITPANYMAYVVAFKDVNTMVRGGGISIGELSPVVAGVNASQAIIFYADSNSDPAFTVMNK